MRILNKKESIRIQCDNFSERDRVVAEYEKDGWHLTDNFFVGDIPCVELSRAVPVAIPETVMDAIEQNRTANVDIKVDGVVHYFGMTENFIAGIETSLHYKRLSRRRVSSFTLDGDTLHIAVDLTTK